MRVVFDLDGTLANDEDRVHHIRKSPKDWDSYFKECYDDSAHHETFEILKTLVSYHHQVEIWSGRTAGEKYEIRGLTLAWLSKNGVSVRGEIQTMLGHKVIEKLLMRSYKDLSDDDELKRRWLNTAREADQTPDLVFEDRRRVVEMYRGEGIACFQVADGDF